MQGRLSQIICQKNRKDRGNSTNRFIASNFPKNLGSTNISWSSRTASTISSATSSALRIGINQGTLKPRRVRIFSILFTSTDNGNL